MCLKCDSVKTWVNTIDQHTVLRKSPRKVLHIKTFSQEKQMNTHSKDLHGEQVKDFRAMIHGYASIGSQENYQNIF